MNEDQKYLFDLTGYLIVENALTAEEVAQCNAAIDHHIEGLRERDSSLAGGSAALTGIAHRMDMGGMLAWEKPWCEPFRNLLVHPNVKPHLEEILGEQYRLDHGPGLIAMEKAQKAGRYTVAGLNVRISLKPISSNMGAYTQG